MKPPQSERKESGVLVLVINTGSTSTKLAVFRDQEKLFEESLEHTREELDCYDSVLSQADMRTEATLAFIQGRGYKPRDFDVIASRGGAFGIFSAGGYVIDEGILRLTQKARPGFPATASWLAAIISGKLSKSYGIPAYFYDAVRTDELCEYARYSGISLVERKAAAHPLNTKAVARRVAKSLGTTYSDCNLLMCHLGGGISIEIHEKGRMIDKICSEEGAFTPERAGNIPNDELLELCFCGRYTKKELNAYLRGHGGLVDYLGTNSLKEAVLRAESGEKKAETILHVMAYMVAKDIGAMASTVCGRVDRIVFTGGMAYSAYFTELIRERVEWIAPVVLVPGSFELEALAEGVLRIYHGEEEARIYEVKEGEL